MATDKVHFDSGRRHKIGENLCEKKSVCGLWFDNWEYDSITDEWQLVDCKTCIGTNAYRAAKGGD